MSSSSKLRVLAAIIGVLAIILVVSAFVLRAVAWLALILVGLLLLGGIAAFVLSLFKRDGDQPRKMSS